MVDSNTGATDVGSVDHGFRSELRLHAAADFSLVFACRRVLRGGVFDLHYRFRESGNAAPAGSARLGLVVAKKLARRAVLRNLLKRLAREAFRHARYNLPSYDLVLRLAKSPGKAQDEEVRRALRTDIELLLSRLPR